ncbi:glycosyltransferase family 4 protein [Gellertiella hungarica]|uniref:Glycosyltransferase involved in cell wall biosynthesis n=1 Tax=Gellertiella hungarica TaxID=1572859 RepID=A0A7W6J841_9HYPH|nr:glycosyltransferase family 4 protein [Gellertiella hungarica]MBB4066541.1 glycosyltransferase involved in cell wall biosynthesis [Gellertiella hungarica]
MHGPRVLFVSQTGVMSGAEYVLASLTEGWAGASAFLLEGGPLEDVLRKNGLSVEVAPAGAQLGAIRRDQSLLKALPLVLRLQRLVLAIIRAARRHDIVYANSQKAFLLSALASHFFRRPLVWHLHDIMDERHFGRKQRLIQIALANRRAASVIVPSKAAADAFVAAGGRRDLVRVVPNGIALAPPPALSREALGLPPGPLVGVFSRLAPWKGQHVVIEALKACPGIRCILVGSALFGEDAYRDRLLAMVAEQGLSERVTFLGQRSDVPTLMQAVDAVIHPSVDPEPFGLTLVEAMLAGTPVIATDAGASAEILAGGQAGTLVPPGDAAALAGALRGFFDDPAPSRQKAALARERVGAVYGIARMRETVLGLVAAVQAGRRP